MDTQLRQAVKASIEEAIRNFFHDKKVDKKHILDILFPKERRIRSLIGGLETSLGTVWESIAKTLAESNNFKVIPEPIKCPDPFPSQLRQELNELITMREKQETFISTIDCIDRLREVSLKIDRENLKFVKASVGSGTDIRLFKDNIEYAFDTKTTQPNVKGFKGFNSQLLEWYAYRLADNPNVQLHCRIIIPFNPFKKDWYETQKSKLKCFLDTNHDLWVGNEFWDFCSGESNTWEEIIDIFYELRKEGFAQKFQDIFEDK